MKTRFLLSAAIFVVTSVQGVCSETAQSDGAVCIDRGRQLLVDTFLIESTDLERIAHRPEKVGQVMSAQTELEMGRGVCNQGTIVNDGGIWWDPSDEMFKMWYQAGWLHTLAYAESSDGLNWVRPSLDVEPGTNRILPDITPDSSTIWLDHAASDPAERYKMFVRPPIKYPGVDGEELYGWCLTSADGIHWDRKVRTGICGDRTTVFYNPFSSKWVYSIRNYGWLGGGQEKIFVGRYRRLMEHHDFIQGAKWERKDPVFWLSVEKDTPDPYLGEIPQLYNFSAVPYESIMIGMFQVLFGPDNEKCSKTGAPKITDLMVAYSRDGYKWDRTDTRAFIPASRYEGAWDRGYLQPAGGVCAIVGDQLWFWYTGFEGRPEIKPETPGNMHGVAAPTLGMYDKGSIGLALLRRDGFVSYSSSGGAGELLTVPVVFSGSHLFVNVDCPEGELKVEVLDADTLMPLPELSLGNCRAVREDKTMVEIKWKGVKDISALAGKNVRFRFVLENGDLYSFWVSPDRNGASSGYNAAGGPGFDGAVDTVGKKGYRKASGYMLKNFK